MNIKLMYYSACGTTKKMADVLIKEISRKLGIAASETVSFQRPESREKQYTFTADDLLVLAMPTFEGRVPVILRETLKNMKGNGATAIVAVTYGNRAYDDILKESKEVLEKAGFKVAAAAAFIAEHSSTELVATGRPDAKDIELITEFAAKAADKAQALLGGQAYQSLDIPGNDYPYKEPGHVEIFAPVTDENCNECMICLDVCPVDAINKSNPRDTDENICIHCNACIKACPENARYRANERMLKIKRWLEKNHSDRKEPAIFI